MRFVLLILFCAASAAAAASPPGQSSTVIGVNPGLAEGARALQFRQFSEGVRLTLAGLRTETSLRQRAYGLSNLCAGYVGLEDYSAAIEACDEALSIRPRFWRALNNRGLAYMGTRQFDAARRDLEQGLQMNPDSRTLNQSIDLLERRVGEIRLVQTSP